MTHEKTKTPPISCSFKKFSWQYPNQAELIKTTQYDFFPSNSSTIFVSNENWGRGGGKGRGRGLNKTLANLAGNSSFTRCDKFPDADTSKGSGCVIAALSVSAGRFEEPRRPQRFSTLAPDSRGAVPKTFLPDMQSSQSNAHPVQQSDKNNNDGNKNNNDKI